MDGVPGDKRISIKQENIQIIYLREVHYHLINPIMHFLKRRKQNEINECLFKQNSREKDIYCG